VSESILNEWKRVCKLEKKTAEKQVVEEKKISAPPA
jgi:hypothetical protein